MKGFDLQCYFTCLNESGFLYIIITLIVLILSFLILYSIIKRAKVIISAQLITTAVITLNFLSMDCETFQLIWLYLGIVFVGGVIIGSAKRQVSLQCQDTIHTPKFISKFENEFKVKIQILATQKIKAFVFQNKIYVTMGLLERLNPTELRAVLAHEVYHVRHSPNKLYSSLLALTSLTFRRHNDDPMADDFAAGVAGIDNLIGAFRKLEIIDGEQRIKRQET